MASYESRKASAGRPSRRGVLQAGLGGAAVLGVAGAGRAQSLGGAAAAAARREVDPLRWLIHHATQGFSLEEYERALGLGYTAWLDEQLDPLSIDDSALDAQLAGYPTIGMTAAEIWQSFVQPGQNLYATRELRAATMLRSLYSRRQLYERVVEFWTDHFNIDHLDVWCRWLKTPDDRDVIRRYALGRFPDLLRASARSAAMLFYLDNHTSLAAHPNENYARELMELHTLSPDGSYTEVDVVEVARCLTGWTFPPPGDPNHGRFLFDATRHDNGAKTVLGTPIPAGGGESDGDKVVDLLVTHPSTAAHLARKLTSWLLVYDPPQAVVDRVAQVFLATGGDITAMVREILSLETVLEVQPWLAPKLKRPYHFAIGLMRAARVQVADPNVLFDRLQLLGQEPFGWPAPNGYPDDFGAWSGGLHPRWGFSNDFFGSRISGSPVILADVFEPVGGFDPARAGELVDRVLTGGALDPADVAQVQAYVDAQPSVSSQVVADALALAASSPSYQLY